MGDETKVSEGEESRGVSRRNALKAGVAVGVGAAAWSGVSITSLGGTPAYAAGCTFAIFVDLTDNKGCRNTDQGVGSCDKTKYGYHPLKSALPTGFSLTNNISEGLCCDSVPQGTPNPPPTAPTFGFPDNLKCRVFLEFSNASDGKCSTNPFLTVLFPPLPNPPADVGPLYIPLQCYPGVQSNTFYRIYAKCIGDSNPPECLNVGGGSV